MNGTKPEYEWPKQSARTIEIDIMENNNFWIGVIRKKYAIVGV